MNVANLLIRAASAHASLPALALGAKDILCFRDLARRVAALAGSLRRRFVLQPGDHVALAMTNSPQYAEAMFAVWHAGLTAVPINAKLHACEFEYILGQSCAKALFVTSDLAGAISPLQRTLPQLKVVIGVEERDYAALAAGEEMPIEPRSPEDTAWLFYTSGTTGRPKGAQLTHRNLLAMTISYFADVDQIAPGDCIIHGAPMSHGSGFYMLPHVAAAAKQVIPEGRRFEPAEMYSLIAAHSGASFFAAPTMVRWLVGHPAEMNLANLKTIVYGGAPMYLQDCRTALSRFGFKLVQIYGQGESPMTITALSKAQHADIAHPRYEQRLASVGVPQTVVEVRVAGPDGKSLPPGEIGEVLVRGDVVMKGYWQDPEASERTLRDGWLHTGDLGFFDEDGFLTLTDRASDLIISGGSNIYPREVEEVLLRHHGIGEVAVVGRPNPEWGEQVVAFVVLRPGSAVKEEDLDVLCLEHMARFKRPRAYRFLDSLPKNNYGKVLKTKLRDLLRQEQGKEAE